MERKALFPGSFDPFTLGHKVVVDQALELFDHIVIAVGVNTEKRSLLSAENRVRLIRDLYRDDHRIEVRTYTELTGARHSSPKCRPYCCLPRQNMWRSPRV